LSKPVLKPAVHKVHKNPDTTFHIRHTFHAPVPSRSHLLDRRNLYTFNDSSDKEKKPILSSPIDASKVSKFADGHAVKCKVSTAQWDSGLHVNGLTGIPEEIKIVIPDVTDRDTIVSLAEMTYNAYIESDKPEWHDVGGDWNAVSNIDE
jgi:putative lipase involved disintegration of autophagic bodies